MPILQWLTREEDVRAAEKVPYRLLEEDTKLGHGEPDAENLIIQGDNLDALKSLLPFYAGQVKCIFIDPPYNTRSAFEHYDDNLEHSQWLAMMWPRLELLRELLRDDGSMWVTLDDEDWFRPRTAAELVKPITHTTGENEALKTAVNESGGDAVRLHEPEPGKLHIEVHGLLTEEAETRIAEALPEAERKAFKENVSKHREEILAKQSPAEKGERMRVPMLMTMVQGELELADTDIFIEEYPLDLNRVPARFTEKEFSIHRDGAGFEIDLENNRLFYEVVDTAQQLDLDVKVDGWSEAGLVNWLDRACRQHDISQAELVGWLTKVVRHLIGERGFSLPELMQARFLLARVLKQRIENERMNLRKQAYQAHLFDAAAAPQVRDGDDFEFFEGMYWDVRRYSGRFRFSKHFLGPNNVPFIDGGEGGEEFQCAQTLDALPEVKYWIRNVARHPNSFWLPTATDRFYPDFIAELNDGRMLVVEYKGKHLATADDAREKETVGQLWARKSNGKGVFGMIVKRGKTGEYAEQLRELTGR